MLVHIATFAVVLLSVRLACGANIRTPPSCPANTAAGLGSQPHFECTASIEWVGDGFDDEHCRAAIQRLYNVEVAKHGNAEFEFLLPGAIPYTSNPVMQTPRRYRVGQFLSLAPTNLLLCFAFHGKKRKEKERKREEEKEKIALLQSAD